MRRVILGVCASLMLLVWAMCPVKAVEGEDQPLAPEWVVRTRGLTHLLAWHPQGVQLASCEWQGDTIHLWQPTTGQHIEQIALPVEWCYSLSWSAAGLLAVVAEYGFNTQVWNATTGEPVTPLQGFFGVRAAWDHQRRRLVGYGSTYGGLWDAERGTRLRDDFERNLAGAAFSPDDQRLALVTSMGGVRITDAASGRELRLLRDEREIPFGVTGTFSRTPRPIAWSPDGRHVAACTSRTPVPFDLVRVWEAESGAVVASSPAEDLPPADVTALAWSPDSRYLAYSWISPYGPPVKQVWLWEVATGKTRRLATEEFVGARAFSPDGK